MQKKSRVSECTENTGALAERLCLLLSVIQFTWCSYSPSSLWLRSIDLKLLYQNCKQSILTYTFANLALPECFSFYYTHRARVKQKSVRSCLVSQNETIQDCTDDITLRVTLKLLHMIAAEIISSCPMVETQALPLRSRFDKRSKIQHLPMTVAYLMMSLCLDKP